MKLSPQRSSVPHDDVIHDGVCCQCEQGKQWCERPISQVAEPCENHARTHDADGGMRSIPDSPKPADFSSQLPDVNSSKKCNQSRSKRAERESCRQQKRKIHGKRWAPTRAQRNKSCGGNQHSPGEQLERLTWQPAWSVYGGHPQ